MLNLSMKDFLFFIKKHLTNLKNRINIIGENPILLLDDFMSELDEFRRTSFLENIKETQVIITCTDKIEILNSNVRYFKVRDGTIFDN